MTVPPSRRTETGLRNLGAEWGRWDSGSQSPGGGQPNCPHCGAPLPMSRKGENHCPVCYTRRVDHSDAPANRVRRGWKFWWPGALLALGSSLLVLSVTVINAASAITNWQLSMLGLASTAVGGGVLIGFAVPVDRWLLPPAVVEILVLLTATVFLVFTFDFCSALLVVLLGQVLLIVYAVGLFLGYLLRLALDSTK